jgi:putative ABC transport system permease protein
MSNWHEELHRRLSGLELGAHREMSIVDEIAQHLDDRVRVLMAEGLTVAEAEAAALADLDLPGEFEKRLAEVEPRRPASLPPPGAPSRARLVASLWQDVRYGIRSLRRAPGPVLAVVAALALTVGPTTATLGVGDWLFWRPTPGVRDAKALGVVWTGSWQGPTSVRPRGVSYPNLEDLRAATTTLDGLAGVQEGDANLAVADEAPEPAQVAWVTSGYFQVLGVRLVAGRGFVPDDDRPPYGQPVAVVSATLARRAFGSPAEALGRSLTLNGRRLTVVGVTDPAFNGQTPLSRVAVWYPGATYSYVNRYAANDAQAFATRGRGLFYSFVVRLAPGATFPAAQAQLDAVVPGLAVAYPDDNGAWRTARARLFPGLGPEPLQRPGFRTMIAGLLVLGGILLLLGCANITNLLLVRELRRHRERAIRLALGASRRRLMQAQLVESMLLAVAGGAVGVVVAAGLNHLIESLLLVGPAGGTRHIPLNGRVLGASLGVAVVCGLAAGLIPAWIGSSTRLESALRQGDSRATSGGRRLRSLFGAVQFALSLALLTGAFLMIATLRQLHAVDLGFDPGGVSTYYLSLDRAGYDAASALSYDRELIDQLSAAPAITTALSYTHPFGPTIGWSLETSAETNDRIRVNMNGVTADYFRVLGVPLVRGRGFSSDEALQAGDHEGMPAVLSESLARRFFAEANPLGRQIVLAGRSGVPASRLTVIGVVGDVHWRGITDPVDPMLYVPFGRAEAAMATLQSVLLVKSPRPFAETSRSVQATMHRLDREVPVAGARPLTASIDRELERRRVFAWALSLLGLLGSVLAAVGLAGLLAQSVTERTREFGVRMALGATRRDVFVAVLRHAAWIAASGGVVGLVLAWVGSGLLEAQLYGVTRFDVAVYGAAAAFLAAVALAAAAWPGWTACRIEPIAALKAE